VYTHGAEKRLSSTRIDMNKHYLVISWVGWCGGWGPRVTAKITQVWDGGMWLAGAK